jgi:hypothetical protein
LSDARLQQLRTLGLSYSYLSLADWEIIAASPLLPRLERLELPLCNARDDSVAVLVSAPSSLRSLSLANGQVGTAGAQAIARSQFARSLRSLDLSWNRLGVRAARALAESEVLAGLEALDLSHCQVGDAGCEALAGGRLAALEALRLVHSRVGAPGLRALAASRGLPALRSVAVDEASLDAATRAAIAGRFRLDS